MSELLVAIVAKLEDSSSKMAINVGMLKKKLEMTHSELSLVKRASANSSSKTNASSKVKVPKLLSFEGLRDRKEIENFLWDIKEYYSKVQGTTIEAQARIATCPSANAKSWWHT
ncbi:9-cis-epoxycarotenoid dioxygenase NCED6 [Cucumis melo var. makuwa]|uniref:9-cis-epoxycarotenoid dioxygenase NCED6 n=1 Tax=Cucumis melo var. makuwa TaxID=1194695 RepID=A0A5A7VB88_CUCMM|nr:9-cis-epoxycarotenoid dioxygenase NCED6 [Cucumis melo var. makuwa]